ncbi:membrane-associated phospholipid phosphatase [Bradyrhizobium sp. USDA 4503]|uniref:phosphatase PAP2 family protein n=1 Tax=Bradyrhizobium TaxID=374 RepID=UPI001E3F0CEF|nr:MULTISPECIES: phosphatase PAP2 family protein [Bradyrhizobium]MCC8948123.1 phosphatase PAP2 family protein [Bradyrhizobium brasilense]MCP1833015.1 membrane-associated phospholipid phosphatase [Bradyrhizobium sp. USDA 4545]MCP1917760.1 membrane-associated phospholipid phosphatase [Bradyrhizobium sp. USDA 4532]
MPALPATPESANYFGRLLTLVWLSFAQLVRAPSHSRRAEAARRSARHGLLLVVIVGAVIITLMYAFDVTEISLMPPRGTPGLWWVKTLTDFGKDEYVLCALGLLLIVVALAAPALRGVPRATLLGFGTRLQYLFLSVVLSVAVGELIKWIVGRGRPFVGGKANAFNFQHFAGTEAYSSFPSGHSITAFALAFAVSAVWPGARFAMLVYALVIAATRLVLLAHHPSDVVAGALVGVIGAMVVRYWFAARRLGFAIHRDGTVVALSGPSDGRLKRVARSAFAP